MSNHTDTISGTFVTLAAEGTIFVGERISTYFYEGDYFMDVQWQEAHGYPETVTTGLRMADFEEVDAVTSACIRALLKPCTHASR